MNATIETMIAGVDSEKARATRELFKAQDATRQALGQVQETSRELRERIDEARAHGLGRYSYAADHAMPRLPPAASL